MNRQKKAAEVVAATLEGVARELEIPLEDLQARLAVWPDCFSSGRRVDPLDKLLREILIAELRKADFMTREIAEQLAITQNVVQQTASKLIRKNEIDVRSRGRRPLVSEEHTKREEQVVEMVKRRATLAEIGDKLKMTCEGARKLIVRIIKKYGEEVFDTDNPLWTVSEVAEEFGVDVGIIYRACRSGEIPCRRRGSGSRGLWLFDEAGIEALREHPFLTRKRVCVTCGKEFSHRGTVAITCSEECRKKRHKQLKENYVGQDPTEHSLRGWHKDLWKRLQTHRISKDEEWLTISEAAKRTGLNMQRVDWLRCRSIVTVRPDPVKKWRGQPIATYAASEMEIVREVYETWRKEDDR